MTVKSSEKQGAPRRHPFFELERWKPWEPLLGAGDPFSDWPRRLAAVAPPIDISESDDRYVIRAELPGVAKADVSVELEEGVLRIRGEKRSRRDEKGEKGRHLECTYGSFSRSFSLPRDADADAITAEFREGVLEIGVAKRPESKPRQIAVKS
jgi:HSP20 family protein